MKVLLLDWRAIDLNWSRYSYYPELVLTDLNIIFYVSILYIYFLLLPFSGGESLERGDGKGGKPVPLH